MKKSYQQPSIEIIEMHGTNLLQEYISTIITDDPATGPGLSNRLENSFDFAEEETDSTSHLWDSF